MKIYRLLTVAKQTKSETSSLNCKDDRNKGAKKDYSYMMKETGESDDQRRVQILFSFPQNFDVRAKESSSSPSYSLFLYSRLCFAFSHLLFRLSFV